MAIRYAILSIVLRRCKQSTDTSTTLSHQANLDNLRAEAISSWIYCPSQLEYHEIRSN